MQQSQVTSGPALETLVDRMVLPKYWPVIGYVRVPRHGRSVAVKDNWSRQEVWHVESPRRQMPCLIVPKHYRNWRSLGWLMSWCKHTVCFCKRTSTNQRCWVTRIIRSLKVDKVPVPKHVTNRDLKRLPEQSLTLFKKLFVPILLICISMGRKTGCRFVHSEGRERMTCCPRPIDIKVCFTSLTNLSKILFDRIRSEVV
jgi:hypothetical protein